MRSLRVTTSVKPWPTFVPWPMPQTLIRQVVRFSGMSIATSAVPSLSVVNAPTQRAVSANLVRTAGSTIGGSALPADSLSFIASRDIGVAAMAGTAPSAAFMDSFIAIGIAPPARSIAAYLLEELCGAAGIAPPLASRPSSSATDPPKTPRSAMPTALGEMRFWNQRGRLDSVCGLCWRRHFQKNSLISGTFEPPEIYSSDLS